MQGRPRRGEGADGGRGGPRRRPLGPRKTVDYAGPMMRHVRERLSHDDDLRDYHGLQPERAYARHVLAPQAYASNASTSVCTRLAYTSCNSPRSPVHALAWMPDAHRLLTGSHSGMFTLWNGFTFTSDAIQQAHDAPVRAMAWSHAERWLVTGDHGGCVKYWQGALNNVKAFDAHAATPIRQLSFAPADRKFASCADDGPIKIWDFETCRLERRLQGHGGDVKCQQWHPSRAMVASGSRDSLIKLWDPRSERDVATLHAHKSIVGQVRWHANGHWLLSGSRDQLIKLIDIRTMRELRTYKGHGREVTALAWHPLHAAAFASGAYDGGVCFWDAARPAPVAELPAAHNLAVWALAWHPIGHLLASASQDGATKFWARNRPGDERAHLRGAEREPRDADARAAGGAAAALAATGAAGPSTARDTGLPLM